MIDKQIAGSMHNFPGKTNVEWFSDLVELHFIAGKMSQSLGSGAAQRDGIPPCD